MNNDFKYISKVLNKLFRSYIFCKYSINMTKNKRFRFPTYFLSYCEPLINNLYTIYYKRALNFAIESNNNLKPT